MFSKMIDMRKTDRDKAKELAERSVAPSISEVADYPYGLCISLDEESLEKLDLDDEGVEVGDTIDMRAFAKVTSVSKTERDGKQYSRIELQIVQLAVEDEDKEAEDEE